MTHRLLTEQILDVLARLMEEDPEHALTSFSAACLAIGVNTAKAAEIPADVVLDIVRQEYQELPEPPLPPNLKLVH